MIVADASAVLAALLHDGAARRRLMVDTIHVPHLVDVEVAHVLRRLATTNELADDDALRALRTWQLLGVRRHPSTATLARMWELRGNVSAYDAAYVSLAEALDCPLLTADRRLASAPGPQCPIEVVPR